MKTIEQLKQEHAAQLAKLERELTIAEKMPIVPAFIVTSAGRAPYVTYKAKGILGALDLVQKFTIVPFAEYRNGCLYLDPLEQLPKKAQDEDVAAIYAFNLSVNQTIGSYGPNVKLAFFARVDGLGLVSVSIDVEGSGYIGAFPNASACYQLHNNGKLIKGSVRPNNQLHSIADKLIKWASGSEEHINYSYLFVSDYFDIDQKAEDLTHSVDVLKNFAFEIGETEA